MNKNGPIIVIEDDTEDQEIMVDIFKRLDYDNEIRFFSDGNEVLAFLRETTIRPFLILSDINMPGMNGFEIRNRVFQNDQLKTKCIPYLFFTTGAVRQTVEDAYAMSVQGVFVKPSTIDEWENTIRRIVEYWQYCISPARYA